MAQLAGFVLIVGILAVCIMVVAIPLAILLYLLGYRGGPATEKPVDVTAAVARGINQYEQTYGVDKK